MPHYLTDYARATISRALERAELYSIETAEGV